MTDTSVSPRPLLFLSHDSSDREAARRVRAALQSEGYRVFMAPDDVRGSAPWQQQIAEAVSDCDVLVVLISQGASASDHVQREVSLAISNDKPILPVRLEQVQLSGSLAYLLQLSQWLDAFPPPVDRYSRELAGRLADLIADASGRARVPLPPPPPVEASSPASTGAWSWLTRPVVLVPALIGLIAVVFALSGVFGGGGSDPTTTLAATTTTGGTTTTMVTEASYRRFTDDTRRLVVEAPPDWDVNGSTATIGGEDIGPGLTVSPDIAAFRDDWGTPGAFIFASRSLLDAHGSAEAYLDDLGLYQPCDRVEREPFQGAKYTGVVDSYSECGGPGVGAFKLVAVPTAGADYLIVVLYKGPIGGDPELRQTILDTFDYEGAFDWP